MITTLIILAVAAFLFVQGKIRADIVGICTLLALILTGILTPNEALAGFSNSIVMMTVAVLIVGGAVMRTGLADIISRRILKLAGENQTKLFVLIMLVTAGIGAFVSNTGTVAVMMPIVVSLAARANSSPSRFLMPLAFASTMGGMLTLIGTTPNMIISSALEESGRPALHFFAFLPIGLICVIVGTIVLIPLSKLLIKKKDGGESDAHSTISLRELADKYQLKQSEHRVRVRAESPLAGKSLKDLALQDKYGVSLVEIRRRVKERHAFARPVEQIVPGPDTVILARDTFSFVIDEGKMDEFLTANALDHIDENDPLSHPEKKYTFDGFGIAEVVILAGSRLVDRTAAESGFSKNYGLRILGIQRKGKPVLQGIRDMKVLPGDSLLVQGDWKKIAKLGEERTEWVVVGQPLEAASRETLDHKAPIAAGIVLLMIAAMAFGVLQPVVAVMLAALALIFTGCFRTVEEAYKSISWQSVVLIASMLPAATALEKTGAAAAAAQAITGAVGDAGPYALLAALYGLGSFVTLFVSNTAAGALCTPIAMQSALGMGLSPYPFLFAVATSASMSLAVPFSTPPNVLVMTPGRYTFMDYVKVGGPLQLLFGVVMVFALPLLFPFAV